MAMRIPRMIRRPVETLRTAPLGTSLVLAGVILGEVVAADLVESGEFIPHDFNNLFDLALGVASFIVGGRSMHRQIVLRNRLEDMLARVDGFEPRIFEPTMREWCDRQSGRIACEQFGLRAEHDAFVQVTKDMQVHARLPLI